MGNYTSSDQKHVEEVWLQFAPSYAEGDPIDNDRSHRVHGGVLFAIKYSDPENMDKSEANIHALSILTRRRADFRSCEMVYLNVPKVRDAVVEKERADRLVEKLQGIVSNIPPQNLPTLKINCLCLYTNYSNRAQAAQLKQTIVKVCDILNVDIVDFIFIINSNWDLTLNSEMNALFRERRESK